MITRSIQLLIVMAGAVIGAALASCAARPPAHVIPHEQLEAGLSDRFPAASIVLEDERYEIVPRADVLAAARRAAVPYRTDIADCDDVASDALYHLRRRRYTDLSSTAPPAAGRLIARVDGVCHALLWHVDDTTRRILVIDPQDGRPIAPETLQPTRVTDK